MKHLRFDALASGRLGCIHDSAHPVQVLRIGDEIRAWCRECFTYDNPPIDTIASLAWYDDHENLSVLLGWLGDMGSPSEYRSVIEKPWKWEGEFRTAVAAREHEHATGHEVLHDGSDDTGAYCDHEGCDWRVTDGVVQELVQARVNRASSTPSIEEFKEWEAEAYREWRRRWPILNNVLFAHGDVG